MRFDSWGGATTFNILMVVVIFTRLTLADLSFKVTVFDCELNICCYGGAHVNTMDYTLSLTLDSGHYLNHSSGTAYYRKRVQMLDFSNRQATSFNTSFIIRQVPEHYSKTTPIWSIKRGDGMTFVMVANAKWIGGAASQLGIFDQAGMNGTKTLAVEFDNLKNVAPISDIDGNHVGIDIDSIKSLNATSADKVGIVLWSGEYLIHVWIQYDAQTKRLEVRISQTSSRPIEALVTYQVDLFDVVDEHMFVGFSAGNGDTWSFYYVSDWEFNSFGISGKHIHETELGVQMGGAIGALVGLFVIVFVVYMLLRNLQDSATIGVDDELLSLASLGGMSGSFSYKTLSIATGAFSEKSKLGEGGFGNVYKGILPHTGQHVAIKKVSANSSQGQREFMAEVSIVSQIRHRNIVQLLGYCAKKNNFLLVYELVSNGSLDYALFENGPVLDWSHRFNIINGTAAALHYLHEGWTQQVIHRDIKSSNIMIDDDFNAKIGDFGLARLVDHQKIAPTTTIVGTFGYIAPETAQTGKFTVKTDVYAFGALALEVACGCNAFVPGGGEDGLLLNRVWRLRAEGKFLSAADIRLEGKYDSYWMDVVLLVGLLCSHPNPQSRPSMRHVVQILAGDVPVPYVPTCKPSPVYLPVFDELRSLSEIFHSRYGHFSV